jgi:hypothetical protein
MLINIKGIKGEKSTGYEPRVVDGKDMGEFECENCKFFDPANSSCGKKEMVQRARAQGIELVEGKNENGTKGRRPVDPEGCCEFVVRIGRPDEDEREKTRTE